MQMLEAFHDRDVIVCQLWIQLAHGDHVCGMAGELARGTLAFSRFRGASSNYNL